MGWRLWVFQIRHTLSQAVQAEILGEKGAFAAAITTGNRSGMGQGTIVDLRAANLAHLLAISGLHMGLLTAFIFGAVRYGLALVPPLALRVPTKKIAEVATLIVGAGYLALSGGNVATERAYIMVAVMLLAVLLDRRALTLRAVAIAATIVLVIRGDNRACDRVRSDATAELATPAEMDPADPVRHHLLCRGGLGDSAVCCCAFQSDCALWIDSEYP
jgi:competence protein ComEC